MLQMRALGDAVPGTTGYSSGTSFSTDQTVTQSPATTATSTSSTAISTAQNGTRSAGSAFRSLYPGGVSGMHPIDTRALPRQGGSLTPGALYDQRFKSFVNGANRTKGLRSRRTRAPAGAAGVGTGDLRLTPDQWRGLKKIVGSDRTNALPTPGGGGGLAPGGGGYAPPKQRSLPTPKGGGGLAPGGSTYALPKQWSLPVPGTGSTDPVPGGGGGGGGVVDPGGGGGGLPEAGAVVKRRWPWVVGGAIAVVVVGVLAVKGLR